MTGWMMASLRLVARLLLRVAMDKTLHEAIYESVMAAEQTGLKGSDKMSLALEQIKSIGGNALVHETESTLRTKVEQALDDLKL